MSAHPNLSTTTDLELFIHQFHQTVETESPSNDKAALHRSARLFSALGEGLMGEPAQIDVIDGFPHLVWRFGNGPRRVVLIGHHDTVWPLGTIDDMPFTISGGIIRGPGTDDMKGGVLIAMHALKKVKEQLGTLDGVTLLVTADEELGSLTSRDLIEHESAHARASLVFESGGSNGEVKVARKGVAIYHLNVTGRAAHAGVEPEKGINATVEVASQVVKIAGLHKPEAGTSVIPSFMQSGTTTNTVPAKATLSIDSRATSAREQQRVDQALRRLRPVTPGAQLRLDGGINRPPWERKVSAHLFARARKVAQELGHDELKPIMVGGGSDGNFTAALGTPTLDGLGTVGGGSHAVDEHARIDSILPRIDLTAGLVVDLLTSDQ